MHHDSEIKHVAGNNDSCLTFASPWFTQPFCMSMQWCGITGENFYPLRRPHPIATQLVRLRGSCFMGLRVSIGFPLTYGVLSLSHRTKPRISSLHLSPSTNICDMNAGIQKMPTCWLPAGAKGGDSNSATSADCEF